ncbi:hypothetical protein V5799_024769 [Amblyomma americanum]|uniref:Uncharacterized protein n=1 Tax=Amblyomma americanum TaxID=6943 RepID=A0AAQ4EBD3_AMBAM
MPLRSSAAAYHRDHITYFICLLQLGKERKEEIPERSAASAKPVVNTKVILVEGRKHHLRSFIRTARPMPLRSSAAAYHRDHITYIICLLQLGKKRKEEIPERSAASAKPVLNTKVILVEGRKHHLRRFIRTARPMPLRSSAAAYHRDHITYIICLLQLGKERKEEIPERSAASAKPVLNTKVILVEGRKHHLRRFIRTARPMPLRSSAAAYHRDHITYIICLLQLGKKRKEEIPERSAASAKPVVNTKVIPAEGCKEHLRSYKRTARPMPLRSSAAAYHRDHITYFICLLQLGKERKEEIPERSAASAKPVVNTKVILVEGRKHHLRSFIRTARPMPLRSSAAAYHRNHITYIICLLQLGKKRKEEIPERSAASAKPVVNIKGIPAEGRKHHLRRFIRTARPMPLRSSAAAYHRDHITYLICLLHPEKERKEEIPERSAASAKPVVNTKVIPAEGCKHHLRSYKRTARPMPHRSSAAAYHRDHITYRICLL